MGSWLAYAQIRTAALDRVADEAFLMEAHLIGTLNAVDQAVLRALDAIGDQDVDGLYDNRTVWEHLHDIAKTQPIVMLRLLNAVGETVLETIHFPAARINLGGEAFFTRPRDGAGPYIGAAVIDPTARAPVFTLSRRIEDRNGRFRGVLLAALDTGYFNSVYHRINPAPRSAAGLIEEVSGKFLAREPEWAQFVGQTVGPWGEYLAHQRLIDRGRFEAPSPVDRIWRYYAYRKVEGYPLVVFIGASRDEVLKPWLVSLAPMVGGSLLGIAGILYFGRSAMRNWRRVRFAMMQLRETNARLEQALADKDVLFREVHHRVKNNLQIVGNLLLLQGQRVRDKEARAALEETLHRVQSVSAVHQVLYRTNQAVEIDLHRYLEDLCATLAATYGAAERGIAVRVDASPCRTHIDQAIPLALIVNEAVTNVFKYAFPNGDGGTLDVRMRCTGDEIHLSVADTGIGLPDGATSGDSLGMSLIRALIDQLEGQQRWHSDHGSRLDLVVPRRVLVEPEG